MISPLPDSSISVETSSSGEIISIPSKSNFFFRVGTGLFLLFWLGGWAVGFLDALKEVVSGDGGLFVMFWLGGWTVAGLFVLYALFRIFRPLIPESFALRGMSVSYDSGVTAFNTDLSRRSQTDSWMEFSSRRIRCEFDREALKSLALRESDSSNRLTIDLGSKRIDLAVSATEVEREWLYETLSRRYS